MDIRLSLSLAAALLFCAAVPDNTHFHTSFLSAPDVSALDPVTAQPDILVSVGQSSSDQTSDLKMPSRLAIVRYVDGEYAKAVTPLPGGKKGFRMAIGKPLDGKTLRAELSSHGAAIKPGDNVQVTHIEFHPKEIVFQLNGGGKKKFHLLQHIEIGAGASDPVGAPAAVTQGSKEGMGATLVLDYGRAVPDMTPDELKQQLAQVLDFSKHSATVNWVDTLPDEFQKAIKNREAVVGMDREMVLAALGRPDHKIRERQPDGDETEDWIYGDPPAKTTFVTFTGDTVVRVKQFD